MKNKNVYDIIGERRVLLLLRLMKCGENYFNKKEGYWHII